MSSKAQPQHFLLVENDPHQAALLANAFVAIPECGTVSVARNVSEAKAYLIGAGVYSDRKKFLPASTILSSYNVDGDSGVDLLAWVKADPKLRKSHSSSSPRHQPPPLKSPRRKEQDQSVSQGSHRIRTI